MTAAAIGANRGVARTGTVRRLATPGLAATVVDVARVAFAIVLVVLALAALMTTGHVLAGPVPAVGPLPGF